MNQTTLSNQQYETIPDKATVKKVIDTLEERNISAIVVNTKEEALEKIKELIPHNAAVMNGSSTSLHQIGFVDYLKSGEHGWNNVHEAIVKEIDPVKQMKLRKESILADYFLGSIHAITENGQILVASNSGSQLPSYTFSSQNVIWVVSTNKIVSTLDDAFARLRQYVLPLEDQRMKSVGMGGSAISKMLIIEREPVFLQRKVTLIFVNERLGF